MSNEFIIRPNRSLNRQGRKLVLSGMGIIMALVTLRFILIGGWMVIPFMLFDIGALVMALLLVDRQCRIIERVVIKDDQLTIHHEESTHTCNWSFPLHWVNIVLKPGQHPTHGSRLLIGSHGEWIELGGFLTNTERESLAHAIRQTIIEARSIET